MTTYTVDNLADEQDGNYDAGDLSLREAVALANGAYGADTIQFAASLAGQTITLTAGELNLNDDVTITGDTNNDRKADITISGGGASRIFITGNVYTEADVVLRSLTMTNGYAEFSGGAVFFGGGSLSIVDSTISNSTAQTGGGLYADYTTVTISNSLITGNSATGATGKGGGICNYGGNTTILNTTIHGNSTNGFGGGIYKNGGYETISSNDVGDLIVINSTITGNSSALGTGGLVANGEETIFNTVIAGNTGGDVTGTLETAGNNVFGGNTGLGGLADNGGPVLTRAIVDPNSVLINAGSNAAAAGQGLTLDATGAPRVVGGIVDIGATEFQGLILVTTAADDVDAGDGVTSLREAITQANANGNANVIRFDASLAGQTLVLTGGQLSINNDVTIDGDITGDDKADITISGNNASRIFNIVTATTDVDLLSLTLTNGRGGEGGAVRANGISSLDIADTTIMNSVSTNRGGGLFTNYVGAVSMTNSLVTGNTAATYGGGVYLRVTTATLTNSTVHGNATAISGGGFSTAYSTLNLNNSTVTANRADSDGNGSGIAGGVEIFGTSVNVVNSVVGDNLVGTGAVEDDVAGTVATANDSIFGTIVTITSSAGSQTGVANLGLGALLDNGGTVLTRSPLDGSILIGFGSNAGLPLDVFDIDNDGDTGEPLPQDGRGGLRIVGGTVDAGAVEQIVDETIGGTAAGDTILGGLGDDILRGRGGDDLLDGGAANNDTVDYSEATGTGVTVNLALAGPQLVSATQGSDTLVNLENIIGSALADTLTGSSQANRIDGGLGIDTMAGGGGSDTYVVDIQSDILTEAASADADTVLTALANYSLFSIANVERITFTGTGNFVGRGNGLDNRIVGGVGNDRFVADQGGADRYFGDTGTTDTMDFRPSATGAIVNLGTGIHGGAALGDLFSSIEYFFGSDTAGDTMTGDGFNNRFDGYGGADTLLGAGGTDTLNGGNGDDEISGGSGLDFLKGDAGADDFNYSALSSSGPTSGARDRILDFQAGLDDIDVTSIDAIASTGANDAFTSFIGAAAFTAEGQIRAFQSGLNTVIEFNTTGTSGAEMQIQLNNFTATNLTFGDFIA